MCGRGLAVRTDALYTEPDDGRGSASWHPERIEPSKSDDGVLVVGGGPAGLECALSLGKRGYRVILAEASEKLGGRVPGKENCLDLQNGGGFAITEKPCLKNGHRYPVQGK